MRGVSFKSLAMDDRVVLAFGIAPMSPYLVDAVMGRRRFS